MTQPRRAWQDKKGDRWYFSLDPHSRYNGVTSAIGVLHKPWLLPWYAKQVAETAAELMMELEDDYEHRSGEGWLLKPFTDSDGEIDYDEIAKYLAKVPENVRDNAGERGDAVHEYCEGMLRFSKGHYSKAAAYYEQHPPSNDIASRCFGCLAWLDQNEVEVHEVEPTLYNDTHNYAGSCDLIATVNGVPRYVDIKTSGTVSDTFALQVAAYAHAEYILDEYDRRKELPDWERIAEGGVLQLLDGKAKFIDVDVTEDVFDSFLSCLLVKRLWMNGASKEAIGATLWEFPPKKKRVYKSKKRKHTSDSTATMEKSTTEQEGSSA